ncbi:MAG: NAD(P)/FAD-dependent oxidoreductase [Pedobacter sp.]
MSFKGSEVKYDVIIIGGSYAGLSAAMALGRSLRKVLIIDSGLPCNRQTPQSHNFITHDGQHPAVISATAKSQVLGYKTIKSINDTAVSISGKNNEFEAVTLAGKKYDAKKLIFATGVKDIMPNIKGFAECWGISVLHCPYCHGFEVAGQNLAVLANGELAFEMGKMIHHWSKNLTILTNGKSTLTTDQTDKLQRNKISIIENEITSFEHENGTIKHVVFKDKPAVDFKAIFAKIAFEQHTNIPETLSCELTDTGYTKVDDMQRTSVTGIYAAGDNTTPMRALSAAIAAGTMAGAMMNKELINESF